MATVRLRPYRPSDRPALEAICCATGLRGRLDALFCDRELFAKLWLSPYLDGEPESALVVEEDGQITGYLVASFADHYPLLALRTTWRWLLLLVWRWLRGCYRHHPPSTRFVRWLLFRSWRENPRTPGNSGHFHFNLLPEARGNGLGECLVAAFEQRLLAKGRTRWYGVVFSSRHHRPLRLYQRLGFEIYDHRPCTLFETPVDLACVLRHVTPLR